MIKVFIPEIKGRVKKSIRGFWQSPEGKIYYDYLKVKSLYTYSYGNQFNNSYTLNHLEALKIIHRQEALFFISQGKGYCFNDYYNVIELSNRIYKEVKNLRQEIKEALKVYGGVTIYKEGNKYFKEIFY